MNIVSVEYYFKPFNKKNFSLFLKEEMEVCDLMLSGMAFHKLARRLKKESRNRQVLKGSVFR